MIKIFSIVLVGVLLTSCSSLYLPNVPNTPMLSKKGEFNVDGHIGLKGNLSVNAAYAVSDHIGVLFSGAYVDQVKAKRDFTSDFMEIGAGYFTTFGEQKERVLEVYGGFGFGNSRRVYKDLTFDGPEITEIQDASLSKVFAQVNFSKNKKNDLKLFGSKFPLTYGTAIRLNYISMQDFTINNINTPLESNVFIEPIFFTRMKIGKNLNLQYTSGSNFGLIKNENLKGGYTSLSFGIVYKM